MPGTYRIQLTAVSKNTSVFADDFEIEANKFSDPT